MKSLDVQDSRSPQAAIDALDALIAMLEQSPADNDNPAHDAEQLEDRVEAVLTLAPVFAPVPAPAPASEAASASALAALTDLIDALVGNNTRLRISERAAVVAAVAQRQPDQGLAESAADPVVLIAMVEYAGAAPGPAAHVCVPLGAATGGLSDHDILAAVAGSTRQVASRTGSPIRHTTWMIERRALRLHYPEVDALAACPPNSRLHAANDRGANPLDVLDDAGANVPDRVSDEEAEQAADALAAAK